MMNEANKSSEERHNQEISNISTYQTPIVAIFNEEPVRLIATGDMAGKSPVCQYIDGLGRLGWASLNKFQVLDTNLLPPSRDAIARALRALGTV